MPAQAFLAGVLSDQLYSKRNALDLSFEFVGDGASDRRLIEREPDLRIQEKRSLIEIERTDEHFLPVEYLRLHHNSAISNGTYLRSHGRGTVTNDRLFRYVFLQTSGPFIQDETKVFNSVFNI